MSFKIGDESFQLQGISTTSVKLISEGNMLRLIQNGSTAYMAQAKMVEELSDREELSRTEVISIGLSKLLDEFHFLFDKPVKLPPQRVHDHRIPLIEGARPVNVRPYKHSQFQKDVIEKMV